MAKKIRSEPNLDIRLISCDKMDTTHVTISVDGVKYKFEFARIISRRPSWYLGLEYISALYICKDLPDVLISREGQAKPSYDYTAWGTKPPDFEQVALCQFTRYERV